MSNGEPTRLRSILVSAAGLLLISLIILNRHVLADTWGLLKEVQLQFLLLLPLIQICSYLSIGLYYKYFFKGFKIKTHFYRMWEMVFALYFVNQILPSGGVSGTTYLIYGLRNKVSTGLATFAQLGRYFFSYFSYIGVFAVALGFLIWGEQEVNPRVLGYLLVLSASVILGSLLFVFFISSKKRTDRVIGNIARFIDWISKGLRSGQSLFGGKAIAKTLLDFHESYVKVRRDWGRLVLPFFFMATSTFFEVLVVYTSFIAIGVDINPGAVFFSFAVANAAGVASIVPGDVGVHEATIVAMLTLSGAPVAAALSATLLYRVYNKFILLPVGFFFYSRLLKPIAPIRK